MKKINIPDDNLRKGIQLHLGTTDPITKEELEKLKSLELHRKEIESIEGIEYAINLKELFLPFNKIKDISPLASLNYLEKLGLYGNKIEDVSVIAGLKRLRTVTLKENPVMKGFLRSDNKTKISYLNILRSFPPIQNMTNHQLKSIEDFIFNPSKETAKDALRKTPKVYMLARCLLNVYEIENVFKESLKDNKVYVSYINQFLKYGPYGDKALDFAQEYGGAKTKKTLMKKILENKDLS